MIEVVAKQIEELQTVLVEPGPLWVAERATMDRIRAQGIEPAGRWLHWQEPPRCEVVREDFFAVVSASLPIQDFQQELESMGLALPYEPLPMRFPCVTLGEAVAWNDPHGLIAQHGTWKDWVLGARFVTAKGDQVSFGGRVSKNVAGFDIHKFLIGSRGAFAVPYEFTLRVIARASKKPSRWQKGQPLQPGKEQVIQRFRMTDFDQAVSNISQILWADAESGMVSFQLESGAEVQRYPGDRVARDKVPAWAEDEVWALRRAKAQFDPEARFNPGVLGVI